MQTQTFRSKYYKSSLIFLIIFILLPVFMFFMGNFELNAILFISMYSLIISFSVINNNLFNRLSINGQGLIIHRMLGKNILIEWDAIDDIQEFTNYHRHFHYIALKQTMKLPHLAYDQNLPKEYRNQAIILRIWENQEEIIKLIRTRVPAKPKQQLFVPIAGKNWDRLFPYVIFILGLGAALLAWSLQ